MSKELKIVFLKSLLGIMVIIGGNSVAKIILENSYL